MRKRRHGSPDVVHRPGRPPKPKERQLGEPSARQVAKASEGELDAAQVRILRALRDSKVKEMKRNDLTKAIGIGSAYSKSWLDSLWALARKRPPLIAIGNYEGDRKAYHAITAAGRRALKQAEDAAKTATMG
jgi:hypothetical protein